MFLEKFCIQSKQQKIIQFTQSNTYSKISRIRTIRKKLYSLLLQTTAYLQLNYINHQHNNIYQNAQPVQQINLFFESSYIQ
ncbi:unnamed protein product [Paramecium octaurelia]|uniref:Uncharacterized protein n=1 Tax=Paramecium octaurelia TaxID=43137 RepID=A0A8S1UKM2_PAROT|nr:unnamed protein product [Paramecium octaurelia]